MHAQDAFAHIESILSCRTQNELQNISASALTQLGAIGFGAVSYPDDKNDLRCVHDGYPAGWMDHYKAHNLVKHSPVARFALSSQSSFLWRDTQVNRAEDPKGFEVMRLAEDFGLRAALSIPVSLQDGRRGSVTIINRSDDLDGNQRLWMTVMGLAIYSQGASLANRADDYQQLTDREIEVLKWMACGKSAEDVADILTISTATVNFHYRNCAAKMGTLNRTHTVVEAMRRGALKL